MHITTNEVSSTTTSSTTRSQHSNRKHANSIRNQDLSLHHNTNTNRNNGEGSINCSSSSGSSNNGEGGRGVNNSSNGNSNNNTSSSGSSKTSNDISPYLTPSNFIERTVDVLLAEHPGELVKTGSPHIVSIVNKSLSALNHSINKLYNWKNWILHSLFRFVQLYLPIGVLIRPYRWLLRFWH